MKISIIVPVYNTELYLRECIDSVLAQTYSDFELILVDDGSTDNSGIICDEYVQKDNRIKVFHELNLGVSSARNKGLKNITGEWLLFLDSDDTLHLSALERLNKSIESCPQVDIIQFAYTRQPFYCLQVDNEGDTILHISPQEYITMGLYNVCAAGSLIKVKLINDNNIKFDSNLRLAEDQVFVFQVLQKSKWCSRLSDVLYYYRDNRSSATNTARPESMLQTIRSLECYKTQIPLAIEQFDNVIMSFIYYMVVDRNIPINFIVNIYKDVNVKYVHRCTRGVRLLYYLSKISVRIAVLIIRKLKSFSMR